MAWILFRPVGDGVSSHPVHRFHPFHSFDGKQSICAWGHEEFGAGCFEVSVFSLPVHFTFVFGYIPKGHIIWGLRNGLPSQSTLLRTSKTGPPQ